MGEDMVLHNAGQPLTGKAENQEHSKSYIKVAYELRMHVAHEFTCKAVFWAKETINFEWEQKILDEDKNDKHSNIKRRAFKAKLLCAKKDGEETTTDTKGEEKKE